nr:transglutaminase domain-containing protein [Mycoplasmopsis californica]
MKMKKVILLPIISTSNIASVAFLAISCNANQDTQQLPENIEKTRVTQKNKLQNQYNENNHSKTQKITPNHSITTDSELNAKKVTSDDSFNEKTTRKVESNSKNLNEQTQLKKPINKKQEPTNQNNSKPKNNISVSKTEKITETAPKSKINEPIDKIIQHNQDVEKKIDDNSISSKMNEQEKIVYPKQFTPKFIPTTINEEEIKRKILSTKKTTFNYFSHPNYSIKNTGQILNSHTKNQIKLELIDEQGNTVNGVKWYVMQHYPQDNVFPAEATYANPIVDLKKDGTISALPFNHEDRFAEIWAEYQGALFRTTIKVLNFEHSLDEWQEEQARQEAIKISQDWHNLSPFQKALNAYEWITKNVAYEERGEKVDQTAYSSIIEKRSVCTGYTRGFKMFMDILGVPCQSLTGDVDDDSIGHERHIWNLVELDDGWYHVDATWGINRHKPGDNNYNYFLLGNDDFGQNRDFIKPDESIMGKKYRFAMIKNYAPDVETAEKIIERTKLENPDSKTLLLQFPLKFEQHRKISDLITKNISPYGAQHTSQNRSFNIYKFGYQFWNSIRSNQTNISKHPLELVVDNDSKFIRIKNTKNIDINVQNIEIEGAFIEKIERNGDDTLIYLNNFKQIGENEVSISIFKFNYDFNVKNQKLKFNVTKHNKPDAYFEAKDPKSGILKNVDSTMEYRTGNGQWHNINNSEVELTDVGTKPISIRVKATPGIAASDIQIIQTQKHPDIRGAKVFEGKIIGVDKSMQYRKINTNDWNEITTHQISGLDRGTYEIRVKPGKNILPSEYVVLTI